MGCEVSSCEASAIICKVELKFANLTIFSSLRLDQTELDHLHHESDQGQP